MVRMVWRTARRRARRLLKAAAHRRPAGRVLAIVLVAVVVMVAIAPRSVDAGANPWTKAASQPNKLGDTTRGAAMATGPNGTVVEFGGCCARLNDGVAIPDGFNAWVWNGASWAQLPSATPAGVSVGPRFYASMAFDEATGTDVMVGGQSNGNTLLDASLGEVTTWQWNGSAWTSVLTDGGPVPRTGAAMAYDPAIKKVVLYGGLGASGRLSDTWLWDGQNWTLVPPSTGLPALFGASMTFDPLSQRVILFGGDTQGVACVTVCPIIDSQATWVFDGNSWTLPTTKPSPAPRHLAGLATDPTTCNVVMFGGAVGASTTPLGDTWMWDGAWHQQSVNGGPGARSEVSFAYDLKTQSDVLFGGINGTILPETWLYRASTSSCAPTPTPIPTPTPTLPKPTLKFDRSVTADGFVVQVTGADWQPGKVDNVTLTWTVEGARPTSVVVSTVASDGAGGFKAAILIFPHDFPGPRILTGTDGTFTATAGLLIVPSPGEPPRYFIRR
jgi:hypothetical protein